MVLKKEEKTMQQLNLKDKLTQISTITNICDHYGYIKIDTVCPIKYCNEFLVLYAKETDDGILLTDLSETFEDSSLNGISEQVLKSTAQKFNLSYNDNTISTITTNIESSIQAFFNLIHELDL